MDADSPFQCPYCDCELNPPENAWHHVCPQCSKRLDLKSQYAFLRGLDAFREGQDLFQKISPRKRRLFFAQDETAMELFRQAYSSLQVAFTVYLEDRQRQLGVEMMASMTQEFLKRSMTSPLEAQYWNTLMVVQTAQNEYDQLTHKLSKVSASLWGQLQRWRWNARQKQLRAALVKQESKLDAIEQQIEFTEPPRVRSMNWKP